MLDLVQLDQTMGNWVSKEEIIRELETIKIQEIPVDEADR